MEIKLFPLVSRTPEKVVVGESWVGCFVAANGGTDAGIREMQYKEFQDWRRQGKASTARRRATLPLPGDVDVTSSAQQTHFSRRLHHLTMKSTTIHLDMVKNLPYRQIHWSSNSWFRHQEHYTQDLYRNRMKFEE